MPLCIHCRNIPCEIGKNEPCLFQWQVCNRCGRNSKTEKEDLR